MSALGTAKWIEPNEAENRFAYNNSDFWLGRSLSGQPKPIGYNDDRHICLVSGSRGGKGTSVIVPNLCLWPGSVVVVDPKGENATVTAARRGKGSEHCEGMGQAVHVLDPFQTAQVEQSYFASFNPLDALDPASEEVIDEAGRIADALVVMQDGKDPFWDESARAMIKALILHVISSEVYEGRRNLITVRDLLSRGDAEAVEALKSIGEDEIPTGHELLWEGLSRNPAYRGTVAGVGERFRDMAIGAPKQFQSVLQVAIVNTEFLDSPGMQRCLERSDFALSDLKTDPRGVSVYLTLPQRYMRTHFRWLRMMISLITTEMEKIPGQPRNGHRVLMCLDEFAGLKRMEVIESAVAQIAGFGVKLFFVLQSLEQLKATYKDSWETFLANAGLKIFFNLEDHFSREYVSKMIGDTEVIRETRSLNFTESRNETTTQTDSWNSSTSTSENQSQTSGKQQGGNSNSGYNTGSNWDYKWFLPFRFNQKHNEGYSYGKGKNWGSNESQTSGSGYSETEGIGGSTAYQSGSSFSQAQGQNETVHRRPLVHPNEIGELFRTIREPDESGYPGAALVLTFGRDPLAVKRANYYEDPFFRKSYQPHPDHPNSVLNQVKVNMPRTSLLRYVSAGQIKELWQVGEGSVVNKGDVLVKYANLKPTGRFQDHKRHWQSDDDNTLVMTSPVTGIVESIGQNDQQSQKHVIIATEQDWKPKRQDHLDARKQAWYQGYSVNGYDAVQLAHNINAHVIETMIVPIGTRKFWTSVALFPIFISLLYVNPVLAFIVLFGGIMYVLSLKSEIESLREKNAGFKALGLPN